MGKEKKRETYKISKDENWDHIRGYIEGAAGEAVFSRDDYVRYGFWDRSDKVLKSHKGGAFLNELPGMIRKLVDEDNPEVTHIKQDPYKTLSKKRIASSESWIQKGYLLRKPEFEKFNPYAALFRKKSFDEDRMCGAYSIIDYLIDKDFVPQKELYVKMYYPFEDERTIKKIFKELLCEGFIEENKEGSKEYRVFSNLLEDLKQDIIQYVPDLKKIAIYSMFLARTYPYAIPYYFLNAKVSHMLKRKKADCLSGDKELPCLVIRDHIPQQILSNDVMDAVLHGTDEKICYSTRKYGTYRINEKGSGTDDKEDDWVWDFREDGKLNKKFIYDRKAGEIKHQYGPSDTDVCSMENEFLRNPMQNRLFSVFQNSFWNLFLDMWENGENIKEVDEKYYDEKLGYDLNKLEKFKEDRKIDSGRKSIPREALSAVEREALLNITKLPYAQEFLGSELIGRLEEIGKKRQVPDLWDPSDIVFSGTEAPADDHGKTWKKPENIIDMGPGDLAKLYEAVLYGKKLCVDHDTMEEAIPVRLEYSCRWDRFRVLMYKKRDDEEVFYYLSPETVLSLPEGESIGREKVNELRLKALNRLNYYKVTIPYRNKEVEPEILRFWSSFWVKPLSAYPVNIRFCKEGDFTGFVLDVVTDEEDLTDFCDLIRINNNDDDLELDKLKVTSTRRETKKDAGGV